MRHDWGADMKGFLAWLEANPPSEEQLALGRNYRGNDKDLGHENLLRQGSGPGIMVPGYERHGMDPGLFWNGSDY